MAFSETSSAQGDPDMRLRSDVRHQALTSIECGVLGLSSSPSARCPSLVTERIFRGITPLRRLSHLDIKRVRIGGLVPVNPMARATKTFNTEHRMDDETTNDAGSSGTNPAELALKLYKLLEPVDSDVRRRAIQATLAALGETSVLPGPADAGTQTSAGSQSGKSKDNWEFSDLNLGSKAIRWLERNGISRAILDEVFHISDGVVEITAPRVPGKSKREMTINCYLLSGIRGLLATDAPTLNDSDTISLCKRLTAYDKNNHPAYRSAVGNRMIGSKPTFTLTGPGENAAAQVVKSVASRDES